MKIILLHILTLIPIICIGQGTLSVDRSEIRIGDQIKATIQADLSNGKEWVNADKVWPDSMTGIEMVNGPIWNRDRPEATTATWTIAFFDTGWVKIPSLLLVFEKSGTADSAYTNDIPVMVNPVEPDSTGLADIKEIYEQPFNPGYYKKYIPHVVFTLLLISGLLLWLRQRKSKRRIPESATLPLLPHEWAAKALDELAEKKLWQKGDIKDHYTSLTLILREYLERRYGIHAMEQTSDEILVQLRRQQLSHRLLIDTEELISVADLIKFAKADPGTDIHAATIERVRNFVAETTPVFQQEKAAELKPDSDETVE